MANSSIVFGGPIPGTLVPIKAVDNGDNTYSFAVSGSGTTTVQPLGAANSAVSRVTSTNAAQTLFIARATRAGVLVRNTDTTNSVWIGPATVTTSNGFLLKAGESVPLTFVGLYQVIDNGSHATVHVMDEYN